MRHLLAIGAVLLAAGCTTAPSAPPVVTWQYGTGAGDGVQYSGAKPTYARIFGAGAGDGVTSGQTSTTNYAYGAEGQTGTMVQIVPKPPTVVAAPAQAPSPNTHS